MKVLIREPINQPLQLKEITGTLEELQEIVGGYIEVVRITPDILCICNEDGKRKNLGNNFYHDFYGWILGTVIFASDSGKEFGSLTDSQVRYVQEYIGFPVI